MAGITTHTCLWGKDAQVLPLLVEASAYLIHYKTVHTNGEGY